MRAARFLRFSRPPSDAVALRGAGGAVASGVSMALRGAGAPVASAASRAVSRAIVAITLLLGPALPLPDAVALSRTLQLPGEAFVRAFPLVGDACAAQMPSPDLSFRVILTPDSITVGDPIAVVIEGAGPPGATLLLPQLADSVGPFTVLDAGPVLAGLRDGKVTVQRTAKVTRFRTGEALFPELPLLWVRAPGDTAVAFSTAVTVRVGSLLDGPADPSKLHDLKPVVPLARPRWWLWALIALGAAAAAYAAWRFRHLLRRRRVVAEPPPPPPLPPEVAFQNGLDALLARRLPELGLVKDYYGDLSLLFRRYIEDRFGFPAVEETRREVMRSVEGRPDLRAEEKAVLAAWLAEDELVKFAKMGRLLGEVAAHTDRARAWVRATTAPLLSPRNGAAAGPAETGPAGVAPAGDAPSATAPVVSVPAASPAAAAGSTDPVLPGDHPSTSPPEARS